VDTLNDTGTQAPPTTTTKDREDDADYVFRALDPSEQPALGVFAKDPNRHQ
jgi:hypothetical protein